jgi:hypothetical protein
VPPGATPCFTNAVPAGYGTFLLHKSASFTQAPGTTATATGALARIDLQSPSSYLISNAIVSGPNAFKANLVAQGNGASAWSDTGTEAELQLRLPAGAWSTQFQLVFTNDDTFVGFFPFTLASNLPPVPEVLNLAAAQTIDAAAPSRSPGIRGSPPPPTTASVSRFSTAPARRCSRPPPIAPGAVAPGPRSRFDRHPRRHPPGRHSPTPPISPSERTSSPPRTTAP